MKQQDKQPLCANNIQSRSIKTQNKNNRAAHHSHIRENKQRNIREVTAIKLQIF